jgi:hypothetical protein
MRFKTLAYWAAALPGVFCGAVLGAETKPNFILIVADNLGYGDVGCFGSTVNRTPNLDRMAAEGVKLTSKDVWPLLSGAEGAESPHQVLYFSTATASPTGA